MSYTKSTGKTTVYDSCYGAEKYNRIYDTDNCKIKEIYTNGWCKVNFPLDDGGSETGYCKTSVFFSTTYSSFKVTTSKKITLYRRSDLKNTNGSVASGTEITIIGHTTDAVQIMYSNSGTQTIAWAKMADTLKFIVKYNANASDGTGSMSNGSAIYKQDLTLSANKFKRDGYVFKNWTVYRTSDKKWFTKDHGYQTEASINNNGYTKWTFSDGETISMTKGWFKNGKTNDELTFHANWTANKLYINYNANGASISSDTYKLSSNNVYLIDGNSIYAQKWTYNNTKQDGLINASTFGLSKTGYKFAGWNTKANGSGTLYDQNDNTLVPTNFTSAIKTGDVTMTLYAIWTPLTYSVKFNANGGTGAPSAQTKTYGVTLTLSSQTPTREGYIFKGWATSTSATSAAYQAGGSYTANSAVTLYAVWQADPNYTPVHEHSWSSAYTVDIQPTCTEEGVKSIHCLTCGETKNTTVIPALGHDFSVFWTYDCEATCTSDGLKSHHCTRCGATADETVIPATGHSFGEWIIDEEADCGRTGERHRICSVCNETEVETIPAAEHDWAEPAYYWSDDNSTVTAERVCINNELHIETETVDVTSEILEEATYEKEGAIKYSAEFTNPAFTAQEKTEQLDRLVEPIGNFEYEVVNNRVEITGYNGDSTTLYIPETLEDMPVVRISETAFTRCTSLTNVILPNGIENIGDYAFLRCTNMTNITIPSKVEVISSSAFSNCSSLSTIYGFTGTYAEEYALANGYVFVSLNAEDPSNFDYETVGDSIQIIGYNGEADNLIIPTTIDGKYVTRIDETAFTRCTTIESVVLPNHLEEIGDYAFTRCTIMESITIPASVTSIGNNVFNNCYSLSVIYGYLDTAAQEYAENNGVEFIYLDIINPGDLNADGDCNLVDYAALKGFIGGTEAFTNYKRIAADMDGDGANDAFDLFYIDRRMNA